MSLEEFGTIDAEARIEPVCVNLSFPAAPEHIRLARLVATGIVAQLDYGLDDLDDVRIAVDELCATVVGHADPTTVLNVTFEVVDGELAVLATAPVRPGVADVEIDELTDLILRAAVDGHELACLDGTVVGRLRKRPAIADG